MTTGADPLLLEPTGVSQLMKLQALGPVVRATAMFYFHLCPSCTIRHYEAAVGAFRQPPVRPPTLVFYSLDDPLCDNARLQELLAVLLRMAEQLPWLQVLKLDKRSVVKHIGDLLQHRHMLVRKAFRDGTAEMDAGEKEPQGQGQGQGLGDGDVGSSSSELPAGKRPASPALLLPPCMLKPPKRVCPIPPVSTVTGDEDISDSEIEQYLRTPQEIRDFQKAQAARQAAQSVPNPT